MSRPLIFALVAFCVACFAGGSQAHATALYLCDWTGEVQQISGTGEDAVYHIVITERDADSARVCPPVGQVMYARVSSVALDVGTAVVASHVEVSGDLTLIDPQGVPVSQFVMLRAVE